MLATLIPPAAAPPSPWLPHPPAVITRLGEQLAPGVAVLHLAITHRQPGPGPWDPPRWHGLALCRQTGWAAWFGDDDVGDRPTLRPTVLAAARALCAACPVRRRCLTHALTHPEHYGVWAGTSGRQREAMLERLAAGVPLVQVVDEWLAP